MLMKAGVINGHPQASLELSTILEHLSVVQVGQEVQSQLEVLVQKAAKRTKRFEPGNHNVTTLPMDPPTVSNANEKCTRKQHQLPML